MFIEVCDFNFFVSTATEKSLRKDGVLWVRTRSTVIRNAVKLPRSNYRQEIQIDVSPEALAITSKASGRNAVM